MMPAVHLQHLAAGELLLHQAGQRGSRCHPDFVRNRRQRRIHLVADRLIHPGWNVLHQRAAGGDVDDLQATADGQHRRVARQRQPRELQLERVADRVGRAGPRVDRLAVVCGIHISASVNSSPSMPSSEGGSATESTRGSPPARRMDSR
jgi:hypothetical protein